MSERFHHLDQTEALARVEGIPHVYIPPRSVPFLAPLLNSAGEKNSQIKPIESLGIAVPPENVEQYLRTLAVRQIDLTGLVPRFLGMYDDPNRVMTSLREIAENELSRLQNSPAGAGAIEIIQRGVSKIEECSPEQVMALDESWGRVVREVQRETTDYSMDPEYNMRPTAYRFAYTTRDALNALKRAVGNNVANLVILKRVWNTEQNELAVLRDIEMGYIVPKLTEEQREALLSITPPDLRRGNELADPKDLVRSYLLHGGAAGHPTVRGVSAVLRQQQNIRDWNITMGNRLP